MAVKAVDLEAELIDTVCARIRERIPDQQVEPCEAFVRQYYHWVPAADIAGRSPLDRGVPKRTLATRGRAAGAG